MSREWGLENGFPYGIVEELDPFISLLRFVMEEQVGNILHHKIKSNMAILVRINNCVMPTKLKLKY